MGIELGELRRDTRSAMLILAWEELRNGAAA